MHPSANGSETLERNRLIEKIIQNDYSEWGAGGREFKSHRPDQIVEPAPLQYLAGFFLSEVFFLPGRSCVNSLVQNLLRSSSWKNEMAVVCAQHSGAYLERETTGTFCQWLSGLRLD